MASTSSLLSRTSASMAHTAEALPVSSTTAAGGHQLPSSSMQENYQSLNLSSVYSRLLAGLAILRSVYSHSPCLKQKGFRFGRVLILQNHAKSL